MSGMPDEVPIYVTKHGSKIHLQPVCAGGHARLEKIHERKFLKRLVGGEGCKNCIPQPEMIKFVRKDLKRKGY